MCRSMVDIQSPTAEIRRGKKKERNYRMKIYMVSLLHRATIKQYVHMLLHGKTSHILSCTLHMALQLTFSGQNQETRKKLTRWVPSLEMTGTTCSAAYLASSLFIISLSSCSRSFFISIHSSRLRPSGTATTHNRHNPFLIFTTSKFYSLLFQR